MSHQVVTTWSRYEESAECAGGVLYERRKEPPDPKNDDEAADRQDQTSPPGDGSLRSQIGASETSAPPRTDRWRRRSDSGRTDPAQLVLFTAS